VGRAFVVSTLRKQLRNVALPGCHQWAPTDGRVQACAICGAGCTRDARGVIEIYDWQGRVPGLKGRTS
jgi:hypothetical protein